MPGPFCLGILKNLGFHAKSSFWLDPVVSALCSTHTNSQNHSSSAFTWACAQCFVARQKIKLNGRGLPLPLRLPHLDQWLPGVISAVQCAYMGKFVLIAFGVNNQYKTIDIHVSLASTTDNPEIIKMTSVHSREDNNSDRGMWEWDAIGGGLGYLLSQTH